MLTVFVTAVIAGAITGKDPLFHSFYRTGLHFWDWITDFF